MDTITFASGEGEISGVPVVVAFDRNGKPAELVGDIEPENCDHAGAVYSDCLDLRCPRCGIRLFLPGRFLARRDEETIEAMHALWVRAGWPVFHNGHWSIVSDRWTIVDHPLFVDVGGLAVRKDHLDSFPEARANGGGDSELGA
jgi:hypothetical protein